MTNRSFQPQLGDLVATITDTEMYPAWVVEKDFWVATVLRSVATELDGKFLFKGGTSLSMGWGIIDRFSEDLDLLVVEDRPDLLDDIQGIAQRVLGADAEIRTVGTDYRDYRIPYPASVRAPASIREMRWIRFDTGVRGGMHPQTRRTVAPLARRILKARDIAADYDDLDPFPVDLLHPVRTLFEKLEAVAAASERLGSTKGGSLRTRDGKHLYDVYRLLQEPTVLDFLKDNQQRRELIDDVQTTSERWFGVTSGRPSAGYAACAAFGGGDVGAEFARVHNNVLGTYVWRNAEHPSWKEVVQRVQQNAASLN